MTRIAHVWLSALIVTLALAVSACAQDSPSLGDLARAAKKDKKQQAAKTYDNDSLPVQDHLSVVGNSTATADAASTNPALQGAGPTAPGAQPGDASGKPSAKKMPTVQPGESADDRQKTYDEWQQKLTDQQGKVETLSRDIDLMQREYRLRVAEMYGDAGNRLRNESTWDKQETEYKQKLAEKQKALDEAKTESEDLQEQARKSGVPASVTESAGGDSK